MLGVQGGQIGIMKVAHAPDGGENEDSWGSMTGWRLIAQEVMKGEDNSSLDENETLHKAPDTCSIEDYKPRLRVKSIVAKAG